MPNQSMPDQPRPATDLAEVVYDVFAGLHDILDAVPVDQLPRPLQSAETAFRVLAPSRDRNLRPHGQLLMLSGLADNLADIAAEARRGESEDPFSHVGVRLTPSPSPLSRGLV